MLLWKILLDKAINLEEKGLFNISNLDLFVVLLQLNHERFSLNPVTETSSQFSREKKFQVNILFDILYKFSRNSLIHELSLVGLSVL